MSNQSRMDVRKMAGSTPISKNKLQGKVAIITGGASGIGEATARSFVAHGAHAVVLAGRDEVKGRNVAASIDPDRCSFIRCDVSEEDQVKTLVESTVRKHGRLDIMFSNAGVPSACSQTVLDLDLAEQDKLFAVNVRGTAACVKHAARAMVEGGVRGGSVICNASVAASMGSVMFTDYVMSKHAILGLVRSASLQLGGHGIRVNSVSPGAVGTPLLQSLLGIGTDVDLDKVVEGYSRMNGILREKNVADAVVFLASDDSEFVTGHDLVVDGGLVLPDKR